MDLRAIIDNLVEWGFFDVVLPFLLIYAIMYAILEKSKIFTFKDGSDEKRQSNVNAIVAFVFGLFVIASLQTVRYIQNFITISVLIFVFLLVMLMTLGFIFGEDWNKMFMDNGKLTIVGWVTAGLAFLALLGIFLWFTGIYTWLQEQFDAFDGSETLWTIVVILLIGGVLYWITREDKAKP
ncbi:MAG: hypothetical protein H6500_00770 [Candidatus Woesearchaeota archaeon]|nr:hypothetical protein [Nanoarchaeota archaeon]USN44365.1 MAG: hypothetical protein H6500_00770 [Candidatus Woesearchaeota archaeon]